MQNVVDLHISRYRPDKSLTPHSHPETWFCVLLAGCYTERICNRETMHVAGDILVCPANTPHSQRIGETGARKLLFSLGASTLACLDEIGVKLAQAPALRSSACATIGSRLARSLGRSDRIGSLAQQGLALELLAEFAKETSNCVHRPGIPKWLRLAREYVCEHQDSQLDLEAIAHEVGRHPVHLAREFKRHFGETVGSYQRQLRAARAAELLKNSPLPLTEIALACGFSDHSSLCRTFKSAYGVSPSEYRRAF